MLVLLDVHNCVRCLFFAHRCNKERTGLSNRAPDHLRGVLDRYQVLSVDKAHLKGLEIEHLMGKAKGLS